MSTKQVLSIDYKNDNGLILEWNYTDFSNNSVFFRHILVLSIGPYLISKVKTFIPGSASIKYNLMSRFHLFSIYNILFKAQLISTNLTKRKIERSCNFQIFKIKDYQKKMCNQQIRYKTNNHIKSNIGSSSINLNYPAWRKGP